MWKDFIEGASEAFLDLTSILVAQDGVTTEILLVVVAVAGIV